MSENKFTDTLSQLLDQLETVKTEIEKQNARMKQMEASNVELLEELEKQRNKHCFASSGVGNCDTCRDKQNCSLLRVINKAKGGQG